MASSTRSRSVSVTSTSLPGPAAGVDRWGGLGPGDGQREPGAAPVGTSGGCRRHEGAIEHLAHALHGHDLDGVENLLVDLVQVALVLDRQDEGLQPGAM